MIAWADGYSQDAVNGIDRSSQGADFAKQSFYGLVYLLRGLDEFVQGRGDGRGDFAGNTD